MMETTSTMDGGTEDDVIWGTVTAWFGPAVSVGCEATRAIACPTGALEAPATPDPHCVEDLASTVWHSDPPAKDGSTENDSGGPSVDDCTVEASTEDGKS